MCGICGWYRRDGAAVERSVLESQCKAIVHRGPDDEGVHLDGDAGIGIRRLSIIDLAGGHQPMTSNGGAVSIVCNGEIVNFPALRRELESLGHQFRTSSDVEVILHGFLAWGDGVWPRLEGMFAIALWDARDRSLRLVRDPLGIKPLFYAAVGDGLAFASELKALVPVPGLSFVPRPASIDCYFAFGHVLAPNTIYEDVYKLEPGSVLRMPATGHFAVEKYWRLAFRPVPPLSDAEWVERFRDEFTSTVRRHLVSDVPLGAFLSGGVDSSAVVAAMQRVSDEPVRTFTIGFDDPRFDESPHARRVAEHLGCVHTEVKVQVEDVSRIAPLVAGAYDEPFADSSAVPTWYLSKLAREHVTVALSGDGGDEIFAGYGRHRSERLLATYGGTPLRQLSGLVTGLPPLPSRRWTAFRDRVRKRRTDSLLPTTFQRFFSKDLLMPASDRVDLYTPEFRARLDGENDLERLEAALLPEPASQDPVENLLYADAVVRLPDDMLTKVDRASMAHSLEVRVPFLSHVFVDWAATVPVGLKLRGKTGKWLVREAVEPWLPRGVLDRPKQGFSIPLSQWVRGDLGAYAASVWSESGVAAAQILDERAVASLFGERRNGRSERSRMLYALTMFALWWTRRPRS
jgi:asparagine synthase (glutamine-hydrolysing)